MFLMRSKILFKKLNDIQKLFQLGLYKDLFDKRKEIKINILYWVSQKGKRERGKTFFFLIGAYS